MAASRMLCIRENEKNAGWRKLAFSNRHFSRFLCAREIAFPFPPVSCGKTEAF